MRVGRPWRCRCKAGSPPWQSAPGGARPCPAQRPSQSLYGAWLMTLGRTPVEASTKGDGGADVRQKPGLNGAVKVGMGGNIGDACPDIVTQLPEFWWSSPASKPSNPRSGLLLHQLDARPSNSRVRVGAPPDRPSCREMLVEVDGSGLS